MSENNLENEIDLIEKQIKELSSLKEKKEIENSKKNTKKWLFFKKENNLKNEIEELEKKINDLKTKVIFIKAKNPKLNADLRANIKNELKAYIIQKILNKPESAIVFKEINTLINEIMLEIDFDKNIQVKEIIKDEMIGKLKENFEFVEKGNTNTLESF